MVIWTSSTWLWWFDSRLKPISDNDQAAQKMSVSIEVVKNDTKNHSSTFNYGPALH